MIPDPVVWIGDSANRVECKVLSASISHGRDDPTSQPVTSTATVEILGPLPAEAVIGAPIFVAAQLGASRITRFSGSITDLGVGWDSVDIARPQIIAAGNLGRIGRRIVGDAPWPAELEGARASRILALAGFAPTPSRTDPGTVTLLARDVDRQPALTLAQSAATDGGGILWESLAGEILYADALHRRNAPARFEFRACDVGLGLGWSQTLEGLANEAHVRYGVAPEGGEQPEVMATEPASIAERGTYAASLTSAIATAVDAQARADEIVARGAEPAWILSGLEIDLGAAYDFADTSTLLTLVTMHQLVSVTGLPAGSPFTSALLWVEGWRETIEGTEGGGVAWRIAYATSDYCRTAAPARWDEVPDTETWDAIDPALTWQKSVCMPPQPSHGRWDDAAASLRWNQVYDTATWDTWPY